MIKEYIIALKSTMEAFEGKKRQLFMWILVRGISLCFTPILFPLTIQLLFDAIEKDNIVHMLKVCVMIFAYIVPIYIINYFICYYSDLWVIRNVYSWMKKNLISYIKLPFLEVCDKFSEGEMSNYIISGSWAGVQAWIHLFRLISPIVATIILGGLLTSYSWNLVPVVILLSIIDLLISHIEAKKRVKIYTKIIEEKSIREQKLSEIINKIEYISMNDMFDFVFTDYDNNRNRLWLNEWKNIKYTIGIDVINLLIEKIALSFFSFLLFRLRRTEQIAAGTIGTVNKNYTNFREQIFYVKGQINTTMSKVKPIEKLKSLLTTSRTENILQDNLDNVDNHIMCNNISFCRENKKIIDNINLNIKKGVKVAIIGKNGCGKSTLIRLITGLYKPDEGICYINGLDSAINSSIRNQIMSYSAASAYLFRDVCVEDNIKMGIDNESIKNIAKYMGLSEYLEKKVFCLSGGQVQKVNLARSISKNVDIYIFDEPTASLDEREAERIMKLIMLKKNKTIIFTTHSREVIKYADEIIVMKDGKIAFVGEYAECVNNSAFKEWAND